MLVSFGVDNNIIFTIIFIIQLTLDINEVKTIGN